MKSVIKIFLYENDEKFFGYGPYQLLLKIDECGSLRAASNNMQMAYSKAFTIIKRAEEILGFKLTEKKIGGAHGGGSTLTTEAREFIDKYERFVSECRDACCEIYKKYF